MFNRLFLFLTVSSLFGAVAAPHKIVYLISPPRSLSVAFLRMMEARGDFAVMHEPSQWAFDALHYAESTKDWFHAEAPQTFAQVKERIFAQAQQGNVFVKEMSFAVRDFLLQDIPFLQHPQLYFIFLIRNPHHTSVSFYNKLHTIPKGFPSLIGYQPCYEILQAVQQHAARPPLIVLTEELYTNPQATSRNICAYLGIEQKATALHWKDLGSHFAGKEWQEIKHAHLTNHWHGDAIRSTGFGKPSLYHVDANGIPTFAEVNRADHRAACQAAYEENMQYYQLLRKEYEKQS